MAAIYSGPTAETTCAVFVDRAIQCWGWSIYGVANKPTTIGNVQSVSLSSKFGCAVLDGGSVKCWGSNEAGQLGTGDFGDQYEPTTVSIVSTPLSGITQVATGREHACALRQDGIVFCWGTNRDGELGNNGVPKTDWPTPVQVVVRQDSTYVPMTGAVKISVGDYFSCAQLRDGTIRCWGSNVDGQVGNGDTHTYTFATPVPIDWSLSMKAGSLVAGGTFACAQTVLVGSDAATCWGDNDSGVADPRNAGVIQYSPAYVHLKDYSELRNVASISSGYEFACMLSSLDGAVRCWGQNNDGQSGSCGIDCSLPTGLYSNNAFPTVIYDTTTGRPMDQVSQLALGWSHACALIADGNVKCWGANFLYQLGIAGDWPKYQAVDVQLLDAPIFFDDLEMH